MERHFLKNNEGHYYGDVPSLPGEWLSTPGDMVTACAAAVKGDSRETGTQVTLLTTVANL